MSSSSSNQFDQSIPVGSPTAAQAIPEITNCSDGDGIFASLDRLRLHQMVEIQAEKTPDAIAVIFEGSSLTYRQLNQRANQLAHYLRTLDVGSDCLVGVYLERSPELIVALLGILKAGGAYVPLDPAYPAERLAFIVNDAQVPVILTQSRLAERLPSHRAAVVCLDADQDDTAPLIGQSLNNPDFAGSPADLAYVIYTSGSTGQPKGVMIPHRGICNQICWRLTTFSLTPIDRVLQNISFSFDPSVWQIFWTLACGAQLVLPRVGGQQDSAYLVQLIAQQQITVIALVPAMLRALLEEAGLEQCSSLRYVFCGGEALPLDIQTRFFERFSAGTVLYNVYGPTEASIDATCWTCQPDSPDRTAPIGQPIANTQVLILDGDLQPVPPGEPGELYIGGSGLARGYLNRPDLTVEKFIAHPHDPSGTGRLYKTGDLGRYLPDGNIEFLGRADNQVKVRGFRIELEEIEATLNQHPAVGQSVVIARDDLRSGHKRLIAYVVADRITSEPAHFSAADLRQFLQNCLPDYMMPAAFVQLETLPLSPNGKVDRRALPIPQAADFAASATSVSPRTALEQQLAQIWSQVLQIEAVGIEANFFELGGDSLLALKVLTQIEQQLGRKLTIAAFYSAGTIAALAQVLSQPASLLQPELLPQRSLILMQPDGAEPPLFCIHVLGKGLKFYRPLISHLSLNRPVYGLSAQIVDSEQSPPNRVEDLAAYYIEDLQRVQPAGPYFLIGVSFGGIVAFEMAQQLQRQGQAIGLLAMVDTYGPDAKQAAAIDKKFSIHLKELFQSGSGYFLQKASDKVSGILAKGQDNFAAGWNTLAYRYYSSRGLALPDEVRNFVFVRQNQQAAKQYNLQPYSGEIVLFRAADNSLRTGTYLDPQLGWSKIADSVQVFDVPGDHLGMLEEPNVQALARHLQPFLAAIDAAEPAAVRSV